MAGQLIHIDPIHLDSVWPHVEALLSAAVAKAHGEVDISQLRAQIVRGDAELLVWEMDGQVQSAGTVNFINYPNYRVAYVSFLSGKFTAESFGSLQEWCRRLGASMIQCWTDDAIARLYQRYGFKKAYNVMRIDL
jgi:hypothetical protein